MAGIQLLLSDTAHRRAMPDTQALSQIMRLEPVGDPAAMLLRLALTGREKLPVQPGEVLLARVAALLPQGLTRLESPAGSFSLKLSMPLAIGTQVAVSLLPPAAPGQPPRLSVAPQLPPPPISPTPLPPLPAPQAPVSIAPIPATAPATLPPLAPTPAASPPGAAALPATLPPATPSQAAGAPPSSASGAAAGAMPFPPAPAASAPLSTAPAAAYARHLGDLRPSPTSRPAGAPAVSAPPSGDAARPQLVAAPSGRSIGTSPPAPPALLGVAQPTPGTVVTQTPPAAPPAWPSTLQGPAPASLPPLDLADTLQVTARQNSIAPLLQRLSSLADISATLPRPLVEAARRVLDARLDLSRGVDASSLRQAIARAGVFTEAKALPQSGDLRSSLLGLRALALSALGEAVIAPVQAIRARPLPPNSGDPPRTPQTLPPPPLPPGEPAALLRDLAGQAEAVLSRIKLLQLASLPEPARTDAPVRQEFRIELPLLLHAQPGMMSLVIERDREQRRNQQERGWRLRFALRFAATGEVGAEVSLHQRTVNVALWAGEADTAQALEALLPELAPALAQHDLELKGLRLSRHPPAAPTVPTGQLLDSPR